MGEIADDHACLYHGLDTDPYEEDSYDHTVAYPAMRRGTRTCKFCSVRGLHWRWTDGRWRRVDAENSLHTCRPDKLVGRPSVRTEGVRTATCKFCGKSGFTWRLKVGLGWRLIDGEGLPTIAKNRNEGDQDGGR